MPPAEIPRLVMDTNIVLDLLVFEDPTTRALEPALASGTLRWLVTAAMRDELVRVLAYPQIARQVCNSGKTCSRVLARFDTLSQVVPPAAQASVRCSDRDDQMFINLAVAHQATLLTKDHAVLHLDKRLADFGALVRKLWPMA